MLGLQNCTVVILNWNKRELLRRSLIVLTDGLPSGLPSEIVVVDNGSSDGSPEMVKTEFPVVRLIKNSSNVGIAAGKNIGLRTVRSEFVLLLDDDTMIQPRQLDALIDIMEAHPEAGLVTCMKVHPSGAPMYTHHIPSPTSLNVWFFLLAEWSLVETARFLKRLLRWGEEVPHGSKDLVEIPYIGGAILLVRVQAIREVGLLDENIFFFGEDFDWCYRFRQRGWKILYAPRIRAVSGYGVNATRTRRASLMALRSRRYLFEKHVGRKYLPIFVAIATIGLLPKLVYYGIRDLRRDSRQDISMREWFWKAIQCIAGRDAMRPADLVTGHRHAIEHSIGDKRIST